MLYDANNPILRIVGVEQMRWSGGVFDVKPREYSALAFRISGSATISTGGKTNYYKSSPKMRTRQKKLLRQNGMTSRASVTAL